MTRQSIQNLAYTYKHSRNWGDPAPSTEPAPDIRPINEPAPVPAEKGGFFDGARKRLAGARDGARRAYDSISSGSAFNNMHAAGQDFLHEMSERGNPLKNMNPKLRTALAILGGGGLVAGGGAAAYGAMSDDDPEKTSAARSVTYGHCVHVLGGPDAVGRELMEKYLPHQKKKYPVT